MLQMERLLTCGLCLQAVFAQVAEADISSPGLDMHIAGWMKCFLEPPISALGFGPLDKCHSRLDGLSAFFSSEIDQRLSLGRYGDDWIGALITVAQV